MPRAHVRSCIHGFARYRSHPSGSTVTTGRRGRRAATRSAATGSPSYYEGPARARADREFGRRERGRRMRGRDAGNHPELSVATRPRKPPRAAVARLVGRSARHICRLSAPSVRVCTFEHAQTPEHHADCEIRRAVNISNLAKPIGDANVRTDWTRDAISRRRARSILPVRSECPTPTSESSRCTFPKTC